MKLMIISHRQCWPSSASSSGYAMGSGFRLHFRALSELFDATAVVMLRSPVRSQTVQTPITGHNLSVVALAKPFGSGFLRKVELLFWLVRNSSVLIREILRADAVHAVIPGETGTVGMLLAFVLSKPLLVRHCENWFVQKTASKRFLKWFMERFASNKNVMLATGGALQPPSLNPHVRWIFSTSLTEQQLDDCAMHRHQPSRVKPRLIIACRQEKEKGTGVVIGNLPLILKDFPGASLDVVGDGNKLAEFKKLAVTLGVSDRVIFHGKVNHAEVIQLLQKADLFCLPTSHSEGFPRAVLEALACGLPVITTLVSVLPQLVGAGCGVLLDEVTLTAIAQAIRECLSDTERYSRMSAQAIKTARQYSLERWRDTIGDLPHSVWGPLRSSS